MLIVGIKSKTKRFMTKRRAIKRRCTDHDIVEPQQTMAVLSRLKSRPSHVKTVHLNFYHLKLMKKDKRAAVCILALTMSIFCTQAVYLVSWPVYHTEYIHRVGVWLSYLTSLTDPILLYIFHEKVKQQIRSTRTACLNKWSVDFFIIFIIRINTFLLNCNFNLSYFNALVHFWIIFQILLLNNGVD